MLLPGRPYLLAIASHKGGTGRTTAAAALAWVLGHSGRRVTLVDADPARSASLLAVDGMGQCTWSNVQFVRGLDAVHHEYASDVVVVDSPSLMDTSSRELLQRVDGIVLTCLADPLSIRTVPAAAAVIESVRTQNPRIELLGILIGLYNDRDAVQKAMVTRLQQSHRDILLEPVIPYQTDMLQWPRQPGAAPPAGAARAAFINLITTLDQWLRPAAGITAS